MQNFEAVADEIDAAEENISGSTNSAQRVKELCHSYVVSAEIEGGIKYTLYNGSFSV